MMGMLEREAYRHLARPVLFRLHGGDAEKVHEETVALLSRLPGTRTPRLANPVEVAGVRFPNRVGLAAGMDKDGRAAQAWARLGFGFAELGTVTADAQPGNPKPRVFRLPRSRAVINRMGFNNDGSTALATRLHDMGVRRGNERLGIPLGISIGKTKVTPLEEAVGDYLTSLDRVAPYADYVAVNISSPNTPGLRSLQSQDEIRNLVTALTTRARELDPDPVPVFVKLAPDMDEEQLATCVDMIEASGAAGIIATNTTLSREGLNSRPHRHASEQGGLSGAPLTGRALRFVEGVCRRTTLPVIGVGGIMSPLDARRMFEAGAILVQLYTGFIYQGPWLPREITRQEQE